jgi:aminoglycoside phosphotransferase (APT) family kinase protein
MSEIQHTLEQYLKGKFTGQAPLSITRLEKFRDGWESDNYLLEVEYGVPRIGVRWVWRIYSGSGSQEKAVREFHGMQKLHAAGYSVPQVILLETEGSPVNRPFIIMEFIPGEMMWAMLEAAPVQKQVQLIDQFCQLFAQLHGLDWRLFDDSLPDGEPFFIIDRWLDNARRGLREFPEFDASPFIDWVQARRELYACRRPSPVHQDFHPGNVLVGPDGRATVIDWSNFEVTDSRFDLAWTLVLTYAHGTPELREMILKGYQRHAGKPVDHLEAFEAIACARRLFDLTVSLTQGAQRRGMNPQAVEAMRHSMEAHRRVYRLFIERTGLQFDVFAALFGENG